MTLSQSEINLCCSNSDGIFNWPLVVGVIVVMVMVLLTVATAVAKLDLTTLLLVVVCVVVCGGPRSTLCVTVAGAWSSETSLS